MVFSFKGAGISNISIDFIKHHTKMATYVFPHVLFKIGKVANRNDYLLFKINFYYFNN